MVFTLTLVSLGVLLILGVPIAVSLLISGTVGYMLTIGFDPGMTALAQLAYTDLNSFVIIAIPLYILMGQIMLKGESGRDLFDFAQRIVGRLPGGLAVAATVASAIFAAISGSSTATAATIGSISVPEMCDRGYDKRMAAGVVAVAGTLGILIPPSISFILYSLVTNASVGKLFMAGVLPGIMLAAMFCLYSIYWAWRRNQRSSGKVSISREHVPFTWGMWGSLFMIPLILGGIYTGWFTPTEAAGVGVIYAFILTTFFKRTLTWQRFIDAVRDSVVTSCMILMLIAGAGVFGNTLSLLRVPQDFATWLEGLQLAPWQFLIAVNLLYLVLGMFMDASAAILVTVPILLPGLVAMQIDLVWFGVILRSEERV
jgi:C4-dicarboxylate transporter DctM subunit